MKSNQVPVITTAILYKKSLCSLINMEMQRGREEGRDEKMEGRKDGGVF